MEDHFRFLFLYFQIFSVNHSHSDFVSSHNGRSYHLKVILTNTLFVDQLCTELQAVFSVDYAHDYGDDYDLGEEQNYTSGVPLYEEMSKSPENSYIEDPEV